MYYIVYLQLLILFFVASTGGIASYMRKQSGPSAREVTTMDELKDAMDRLEHSIVGVCVCVCVQCFQKSID